MIDTLLSRLQKVKRTGKDRWIACCPAHDDRSPSLSVMDDNGKILIHCFGGCEVGDILAALGMEFTDLFPPRDEDATHARDPVVYVGGSRFTAADALRCLSNEAGMAVLMACDMAEGKVLSPAERDRLVKASSRMAAALSFVSDNIIERTPIV